VSRLGDLVKAQKAGRAVQLKPKGFQGPSRAWVVIEHGQVKNLQTDESVALTGAYADVDSAGQLEKRVTAIRLILTGPFALGLRKKKDSRELFLAVQGPDGSFLAEVDPKKQAEARRLAMTVNTEAGKLPKPEATPELGPAPSASAPVDAVEQIRKLGQLRDEGLLTEEVRDQEIRASREALGTESCSSRTARSGMMLVICTRGNGLL
jgi:hypothetical protein